MCVVWNGSHEERADTTPAEADPPRSARGARRNERGVDTHQLRQFTDRCGLHDYEHDHNDDRDDERGLRSIAD